MDTNFGQVELVKDINPDGQSYPDSLVEFKDKLYFAANDGETGRALFVSDGTTKGTKLVTDIFPENNSGSRFYVKNLSNLTEFDDKLYFTADNGESGRELFVSDGTAEGTELVKDIFPGEDENGNKNTSSPHYLTEFDGKLYFMAEGDANDDELFVSDGTAEGTQLLVDLDQSEGEYDSNLYTRQFDDFYTRNLTEFNDKLYFKANDGESGEELFVSDGTAEGTKLVKDIFPGEDENGNNNSSLPSDLVEFKDKLYFSADDGVHGEELFVTDGTAKGTKLLADLYPGEDENGNINSSAPSDLVEFKGKLYFSANDGVHGEELFVSDGTAKGTKLLADLYPGEYGSSPNDLVEFKGKLYFSAYDSVKGNELFVSDGTAKGTHLVADINPGEDKYADTDDPYPTGLKTVGDETFFTGDDSNPSNLTVVGDELFFSASNGDTGTELFKLTTDDSSGGTLMSINNSVEGDIFLSSAEL